MLAFINDAIAVRNKKMLNGLLAAASVIVALLVFIPDTKTLVGMFIHNPDVANNQQIQEIMKNYKSFYVELKSTEAASESDQ